MGAFRDSKASQRPYVTMSAAMTLDGKITTRSGDSNISSPTDLKRLHKLRTHVDAVMIGSVTQLSDNPLLTVRRVRGRNPTRIVIDSAARTPSDSKILTVKGATIIAVSAKAPQSRVQKLQMAGAKIVQCGTNHVNLKALMPRLRDLGIRTVLLEGGGGLNWHMLENNLVDELRITIAPFLVGGETAKTLVEGVGVGRMSQAIKLSLKSTTRNKNEMILGYKVNGF